jgi:hypothetical protein
MKALYTRFHPWQGFALTNIEPDLFSHVYKFGFCTIYLCRGCLLNAYLRMRATVADAVHMSEGR